MAHHKKVPAGKSYNQGGELVRQHKRMAMGEQVPQGTVGKKKK